MFSKNKYAQNFEEYVFTMTNQKRLGLMNFLAQHGDSNLILNELLATQPCCQSKKMEVRISENYILRFQKETFSQPPKMFLYKTDTLLYCYYSVCRNYRDSDVTWISKDGKSVSISELNGADAERIFLKLQPFARGLDALEPCEPKEDFWLQRSTSGGYFVSNGSLYRRRIGDFTRKIRDTMLVENIQNIIWCQQWSSIDSEGPNDYAIDVYTLTDKDPISIYGSSDYDVFLIVSRLKRLVPHLMYGPDEQYERIFKHNPGVLMDIAKRKLQEKGRTPTSAQQ